MAGARELIRLKATAVKIGRKKQWCTGLLAEQLLGTVALRSCAVLRHTGLLSGHVITNVSAVGARLTVRTCAERAKSCNADSRASFQLSQNSIFAAGAIQTFRAIGLAQVSHGNI